MRGPISGANKRSRPALMAGSTDVTNSPAARLLRYVSKNDPQLAKNPGQIKNSGGMTGPMLTFAAGVKQAGLGKSKTDAALATARETMPTVTAGKYGLASNPNEDSLRKFVGSSVHTANVKKKARSVPVATAGNDYIPPSAGNTAASMPRGQGSTTDTTPTPSDPLSLLGALLGKTGGIGTLVNPANYANAVAGGQFDPTIATLQDQVNLAPKQGAQDQTDINSWFSQILGSLAQAGTDQTANNTAAQTSLGDSVKGIVAGLGGAANPGSGLVGAAGADAIGTESALGGIQQNYIDQMKPLLQLAQSSASSADTARTHTLQHDLATQLASAQGQRANAYTQAVTQAQQQNAATQQQRLGDQTGILGQIISASLAGNNATVQQLLAAATIKERNAQATKATADAKKPSAASLKGTFAGMSPLQKQAFAATLAEAAKSAGGSQNVSGVWQKIQQGIAASGFNPSDPAIRQWVGSAVLPTVGVAPGMIFGNG